MTCGSADNCMCMPSLYYMFQSFSVIVVGKGTTQGQTDSLFFSEDEKTSSRGKQRHAKPQEISLLKNLHLKDVAGKESCIRVTDSILLVI